MHRRGIVYIAPSAEGGFTGYWDAGDPPELLEQGPDWESADEAVEWGRQRAARVVVRLGSTDDTIYSAGTEAITEYSDGSGRVFPNWPPSERTTSV